MKIKKLSAAALAATIVFGSASAYVAYAEPGDDEENNTTPSESESGGESNSEPGGDNNDSSSEGSGDNNGNGNEPGGDTEKKNVDIIIAETQNGTVKIFDAPGLNELSEFVEGQFITIVAVPDEGYELDTLIVTRLDNGEIWTAEWGEYHGEYLTPPGGLKITATFKKIDNSEGDPTTPTPDPTPTPTPDQSTTSGNNSSSDTSTAADEVIEGEAEVTPGTAAKVETDAGEITVTTDAEDAALEGTKFVVETVKDANADLTAAVGASATEETKSMVTAAEKAVEDGNAVILDFSFEKDGENVQPGKEVTISLPVPAALRGAGKIFIYHISDEGVTLVASPDVKDGTITFTANKFSPYIFSKVEFKAAGENNGTANGTGSNPNTGIGYAFVPAFIAAGAVIASAKKRK